MKGIVFKMNIKDQIKVCRDYDEMSRMAAEVFADYIKKNPNGILGLATGSSPEGLYACLVEKYKKGEEITLNDILAALLKEDVLAIEILESVGHTLGKAIAGLINMFNPEVIVIGGTLSVAKEYLMLPVRNAINKYSLMLVNKDTQIRLSTLGERAGVMGACILARSKSLGLF